MGIYIFLKYFDPVIVDRLGLTEYAEETLRMVKFGEMIYYMHFTHSHCMNNKFAVLPSDILKSFEAALLFSDSWVA